ncbi:hypothetical protein Lal_00004323 [Lupinus albus]|nr:hypothetical protein Lal_00004323 [Lupinus albus]
MKKSCIVEKTVKGCVRILLACCLVTNELCLYAGKPNQLPTRATLLPKSIDLPQWSSHPVLQPQQIHLIRKRGTWGVIAQSHDKFDPEVVREFYANSYAPEEGGGISEHKSWVRGKVIRYDRNYLNLMLNNPYEELRLTLPLMATEIYKTAVKEGKKVTMGFSSLITSLCARQGVTTSLQQPQEQHHLTMEQKIMIRLEHLELQNDILKQVQVNQQQSLYTAYQRHYHEDQVFLSPEKFTGRFPWPGSGLHLRGRLSALVNHPVLVQMKMKRSMMRSCYELSNKNKRKELKYVFNSMNVLKTELYPEPRKEKKRTNVYRAVNERD